MRLRRVRRKVVAGIFAAIVGVCMPAAAHAGSVVDRAEIRVAEKYADIEIKFNVPINIGAYAPRAHGQLLQVGIELPRDVELSDAPRLGATEWGAGSQPSAFRLYEYLRFDRSSEPHHGRIVIRFLHDVDFTVYKSADSRSVVISILREDVPKVRPQKLAGQSNLLPESLQTSRLKSEPEKPIAAPVEKKAVEITALAAVPSASPDVSTESSTVPPAADSDAEGVRPYTALSDYSAPAPAPTPISVAIATPTEAVASKSARRISKSDGWRVYGSFSQYYDYSDIKINRSGDSRFSTSDSQTSQNDLRSYLNLNARYRDEDWDIRSRFNGGYRVDFLDHSQDTFKSRYAGNKILLSDAYVDVRHHNTDLSAKVGRQYGSTGGVFGRFDGAQFGIPIAMGWRANIVAGTPVDLTSDKTVDDTNRYFYGVNFDLAPADSHWQYNFYALQQMIDGMIDRRALGNETRYYGEGRSLLTLLDYDIEYKVLNRAMLIGNWTPFQATALNATLDFGYSPLLSTRNALISQPEYSSIKALQSVYSDTEIAQLARDRTAKYRNILISATQQLNELTQLYGSVGQYYYGA
ncbi:MAG TPA: hypothetical protein VFM32_07450, partial [Spongiibacteraceae bacterium]|nr:hypothetical protein [Spongiibacteraceae bacterium]